MYGRARRRLFVTKVRGQNFHEDYHDYEIMRGGVVVHPRLVAAEHLSRFPAHTFTSGIENLDRMLGGGLDAGTTTLLLGPARVGKSTVSMQFRRECPHATEHFAETAPFPATGPYPPVLGSRIPAVPIQPAFERSVLTTVAGTLPRRLRCGNFPTRTTFTCLPA